LEPTRSNGHPPLAVVFPVVSIYYQKSHQPKWIHSRADSAHFSGNPSHGMECVLRFQPHFRPIRFLATTECVSNANRGPSPSSLRNYVEPLYQATAGRCSGSTMRCLDFNVLKRPRLLVFQSGWVRSFAALRRKSTLPPAFLVSRRLGWPTFSAFKLQQRSGPTSVSGAIDW
jgi:hypothetical protein